MVAEGSGVDVAVGNCSVAVGPGVAVAEVLIPVAVTVGETAGFPVIVTVGTVGWAERTWTATQKGCPKDSFSPLNICQ